MSINPYDIDGVPIKEAQFNVFIQPAKDILRAAGLPFIIQKQYFEKGKTEFFFEIEENIPIGEIRPMFPEFVEEDILTESWQHLFVEFDLYHGKVVFGINGVYSKDAVTMDVNFRLGHSKDSVVEDKIIIHDRRVEKPEEITLKEVMDFKFKSGDPKYASPKDVYGSMNIIRLTKVLNRYLKDWALKHRILERD